MRESLTLSDITLFRFAFIVFILLCAETQISQAQILLLESSESRSLASANLTSSQSGSLTVNPALTESDSIRNFSIGLAITPNEQGLSNAYVAAVEGTYFASGPNLSFSVGASQLAYSTVYSDLNAIVGLSKHFDLAEGRTASVAARFRYESLSYSTDYVPSKFYLVDLGFVFDLSHEFAIGGAAINLIGSGTNATTDVSQERVKIFMLGATYHPSDAPISISTALEQQEQVPLDVHIGILYRPVEYLSIRAGTTTDYGTISLGVGMFYDPLLIDVGLRFDHSFGSIVTLGLASRW